MLSVFGGARNVRNTASSSILDHIKFIDPINPNKENLKPILTGTIFDYYTPMDIPKPDGNEKCYWDKKALKTKADLERAVAHTADKRRYDAYLLSQEIILEQVAESANRRSNLDGELYML